MVRSLYVVRIQDGTGVLARAFTVPLLLPVVWAIVGARDGTRGKWGGGDELQGPSSRRMAPMVQRNRLCAFGLPLKLYLEDTRVIFRGVSNVSRPLDSSRVVQRLFKLGKHGKVGLDSCARNGVPFH
jgi:hypothetical protein